MDRLCGCIDRVLRLEPIFIVIEIERSYAEHPSQNVCDQSRPSVVVIDGRNKSERMAYHDEISIINPAWTRLFKSDHPETNALNSPDTVPRVGMINVTGDSPSLTEVLLAPNRGVGRFQVPWYPLLVVSWGMYPLYWSTNHAIVKSYTCRSPCSRSVL